MTSEDRKDGAGVDTFEMHDSTEEVEEHAKADHSDQDSVNGSMWEEFCLHRESKI